MRQALHELAQATRSILRSPGFTLTASLILALGLGLTSYMFGAVDAYLLRPLPFPAAARLVHFEEARPAEGRPSLAVSLHDFLDVRERQTSLDSPVAFYMGTLNLSGDDRPERFDGVFATANLFEVLGVAPLLGRGLVEGDDAPGAPRVVVIAASVWQQRYGGDRSIVGKAVRVNGEPATIVGVMPAEFRFPQREQVWTALRLDTKGVKRGEGVGLEVFGRLKPGVSLAQAREELGSIVARLGEQYPESNAGLAAVVKPLADEFVDREARLTLFTMFGAVLLVLLIACANVANLMLARNTARGRELAIRAALGAGRARIVTHVLAECLVVSLLGAAAGYLAASWAGDWTFAALRASETLAPPYWVRFGSDWRTLAFAAACAFLATLAAGLAPALRATRLEVQEGLRRGGHGFAGNPLGRLTRSFLAVQLAAACVVLVCGGLTARSVAAVQRVELGADVDGVLSGRVGLFESDYPEPADRARFFERLEERLRQLPGVVSAGISTSLPATFSGSASYVPEGHEPAPGARRARADEASVSPAYFATLRIPILEGRGFGPGDREGAEPVLVVNRKLAERYWPSGTAVGRRIRLGGPGSEAEPWRTVVGVVPDVVQGPLDQPVGPTLYQPLAQVGPRFASLAVRAAGDPPALAESVRKAVHELDPDTPVYWLRGLDSWVEQGRFQSRFFAALFGSFALGGLLLGALGQYAVLAYAVSQRTREIGLRRALGALDPDLLRMTLRDGLRHLAVGLGFGLAVSLGFARVLSGVLYGVPAFDVPTFGAVALGLTLAVVAASLLPARRALAVDPAVALRCE